MGDFTVRFKDEGAEAIRLVAEQAGVTPARAIEVALEDALDVHMNNGGEPRTELEELSDDLNARREFDEAYSWAVPAFEGGAINFSISGPVVKAFEVIRDNLQQHHDEYGTGKVITLAGIIETMLAENLVQRRILAQENLAEKLDAIHEELQDKFDEAGDDPYCWVTSLDE